MMGYVAVYILALPYSVYVLACCLGIIDAKQRTKPLIRLVAVLCIGLLSIIGLGEQFLSPMLFAFGTVTITYLGTYIGIRAFAIGTPRFANTPPPAPPIITQAVEADDPADQ